VAEVYQSESPDERAVSLPCGLEPLRSLAVAVELIPMRSRMALYTFLHNHQEEFPPRYMPGRLKPVRMLYDSEIIKIREMLLAEPDPYHSDAFIESRASKGVYLRGHKRPTSPIDLVMQRAMAR
jgi:hypothetical protein